MAKLLGFDNDYKKYSDLARQIREKFISRFVNETVIIKGNNQAVYALALQFELLPKELQPKAISHMIKALEKYDGRISTGFCTTLFLMRQLSKWDYNDIAYKLLFSRRFPSWFYMIDQGATTMWERWDGYVEGRGFQDESMNSFNHYSIGAVGEWINRIILGINLDEENPGYKHVILKPQPGGPLKWAKGQYESIHGNIITSWKINGGKFLFEVSIPTNTSATVHLPAENIESITEDGKKIKDSEEIQILSFENHTIKIKIKSGKYNFESNYPK